MVCPEVVLISYVSGGNYVAGIIIEESNTMLSDPP
jgi:hypothetical protein